MRFPEELSRRVRFDRDELSGAFGDLGTDFPLVVGMMVLAAGLDVTSVLVMYGLLQILTGLAHGIPMPVQPLKALAVIVITQELTPSPEERPRQARDGQHDMAMGERLQHLLALPFGPQYLPLLSHEGQDDLP